MARNKRPYRAGGAAMPARSIRVSDETWEKARWRASTDGVTVSTVIQTLLDGYGQGLLNLPRVQTVYEQPKTAVPTGTEG